MSGLDLTATWRLAQVYRREPDPRSAPMSDATRRTVRWQVNGRSERTKATLLAAIRYEVFSIGPPEP